jgi:hypothetical protein
MKPDGSLPHSQDPAACPYPKPDRSSPRPSSHICKIHFNINLPSRPGSSHRFRKWPWPAQTPHIPCTKSHNPFPLLTLYRRISLIPTPLCMIRNMFTSPNPQAGGPPLVGCPRCLFKIFAAILHIYRPFLHPQPEDAPCCGDRDPLITDRDPLITDRDPLITDRDPIITDRDPLITDRGPLITDRDPLITGRDPRITDRNPLITDRNPLITDWDRLITDRDPLTTASSGVIIQTTKGWNRMSVNKLRAQFLQ